MTDSENSPALTRGRLAGKLQARSRLDWDRLFPDSARWVAVVLGVLGVLALLKPVAMILNVWWTNSNWNHGFIVPLFALYLLHVRRENLADFSARPSWLGVPLVLFALAFYAAGALTMFGMVQWVSVWIMTLALVLVAGGGGLFYRVLVPLGYLVLAIPWSDRIYTAVTMPMRFFASQATGFLLALIPGLGVQVNGVVLELTFGGKTQQLNVADACAGMHMLVTLVALAAAVAFIVERPVWQRIVLLVVGVPIAIFTNVIRVFITALIHVYLGAQYAEGVWHTMLGLAMLPIALGLLLGVQWLLEHLTIPVPQPSSQVAGPWTMPSAAPAPANAPSAVSAGLPPVLPPVPPSLVRLSSPPVATTAILLGLFALLWPLALNWFQMVLTKEPIPLRRPLDNFPTDRRLAPFTLLEKIKLSDQTIETLGTRDFIIWQWADNRPNRPRTSVQPALSFFVSYDTGKQDSVPHVPEECYLGGGFMPSVSPRTETLHVPGLGLPNDQLQVQFLGFRSKDMPPNVVRYVMYVFNLNNKWITGRTQARLALEFKARYFFRSKVELGAVGTENSAPEVLKLFEAFLQKALPILVSDFWPDVNQGPAASQPVASTAPGT